MIDMREILYRGKTKEEVWKYGYYSQSDFYETSDNQYFIEEWDSFLCEMIFTEITPETVGQYTGLKDRDGKRIFEGDIVKDQFGNIGAVICSQHFLDWRIRFYTGRDDLTAAKAHGVRIFDWIYPKMCLEIIGSVHDNPELLKDAP